MPRSDGSDPSKLEWRIGVAALALVGLLIGWKRLHPPAEVRPPEIAAVADIRGAPLGPAVTPAAASPAADLPPPVASVPEPAASTQEPVAPVPTPAATVAASPPSVAKPDETTTVTIETLSNFDCSPPQRDLDENGEPKPAAPAADPVPKEVRALSGRRVSTEGYMLPFDFANGTCKKFILSMIPPGCCFGCAMRANNWIEVTMAKERTADCSDTSETVRVKGVIVVHDLGEDGSPLYTMTGETVEESK